MKRVEASALKRQENFAIQQVAKNEEEKVTIRNKLLAIYSVLELEEDLDLLLEKAQGDLDYAAFCSLMEKLLAHTQKDKKKGEIAAVEKQFYGVELDYLFEEAEKEKDYIIILSTRQVFRVISENNIYISS